VASVDGVEVYESVGCEDCVEVTLGITIEGFADDESVASTVPVSDCVVVYCALVEEVVDDEGALLCDGSSEGDRDAVCDTVGEAESEAVVEALPSSETDASVVAVFITD
jgi:hypothetical protein